MIMKTQSCKAKGRRLQQKIVEDLYKVFHDLEEGDLRSTPMGSGGEDVQMSAKAMKLIPYSFEAKNQERLNIWNALEQSEHNCNGRHPVVVIKKNNKRPYAVISWDAFLSLVSETSRRRNEDTAAPCPTREPVTETIKNEDIAAVPCDTLQSADGGGDLAHLRSLVDDMQTKLGAMRTKLDAIEIAR